MQKLFIENQHFQILLLVVVLALVFSAVTPPFQSPDEPAHLQRAYLLTKGRIFLEVRPGHGVGGEIDTGLVSYINIFTKLAFHPERKISKQEETTAALIDWTEQSAFSHIPGTGYYFPLAYAPQALALIIGKTSGLTVKNSYYLARILVLSFSVFILSLAFTVFAPNTFLLGLFLIPMSIFQLASASLDAFTFALTILCLSLFMRGYLISHSFPLWMTYILAITVFVLTTSRIHLLPFLILPLLVWFIRRNSILLWQFIIVSVLSVTWTVAAAKSTYIRNATESSTSDAIAFYLTYPEMMGSALLNTISSPEYLRAYWISFIGILGWLDTGLESYVYYVISLSLIVCAIFSTSLSTLRMDWHLRIILGIICLSSTLLVFLALLVTWNPIPADVITGVQGRYFINSMFIIGYALSGCSSGFREPWRKAAIVPLLIIVVVVSYSVPKTLLDRFSLAFHEAPDLGIKMVPSPALDANVPIVVRMTARHQAEGRELARIGVMFGTHARENPGDAELRLKGPNASEFVLQFSLSALIDNKYQFFDLDEKHYSSGEISSITGSGVSTWETHYNDGHINTCIMYGYGDGDKAFTPGCPDS